jgi:hypothetical protein
MTTFQLTALLLFGATLAATKRLELTSFVNGLLAKLRPGVKPVPAPDATDHAQELVSDLVQVAALRDRLEADGCKDGAEACTVLLRILVEYRPNKG